MFGEGFKHMDSFEKLEDGYYKAKIVKAELKKGNFGDYIQAEVEVEGHPNANPHIFLINDSPKEGYGSMTLEQAMEMWCKNTTAFFNAFGITEGDFDHAHWVGKVGEITVRPQRKKPEYSEIVPYKTTIKKNANKADTESSAESSENSEDYIF